MAKILVVFCCFFCYSFAILKRHCHLVTQRHLQQSLCSLKRFINISRGAVMYRVIKTSALLPTPPCSHPSPRRVSLFPSSFVLTHRSIYPWLPDIYCHYPAAGFVAKQPLTDQKKKKKKTTTKTERKWRWQRSNKIEVSCDLFLFLPIWDLF